MHVLPGWLAGIILSEDPGINLLKPTQGVLCLSEKQGCTANIAPDNKRFRKEHMRRVTPGLLLAATTLTALAHWPADNGELTHVRYSTKMYAETTGIFC